MTILKPAANPAQPATPSNTATGNSRFWYALLALVLLIWFAGLGYRPLLTPDEGRYSEIAREMAQTGDFVTPRLNGLQYFEKPPLQYWLTALGFQAFGQSDASARLVTALYGIGTAFVIYLCLFWIIGRRQARTGFLLASGTCWIVAMGHFIALDMGLTFWLTMAACGLYGCLERNESRSAVAKTSTWPDLWVWVGMAGGFLSKGLIAGVIPIAALVLTALWARQPRLLLAVRWWPGVLVFALLVLPWLIAIQLRHPDFFEFFFVREHFQRFTSDVHQRVEPGWYFIPVFLMGGLPWLGHWLRLLLLPVTRQHNSDRLLLAWTAFVLLFFSLSGSKLPSYILPVFPCLVLWLARHGDLLTTRAMRAAALLPLLAALLLAVVLGLTVSGRSETGNTPLNAYLPWILFACLVLATGALVSWRLADRGFASAYWPLALAMLLATQLLQWGHSTQAENLSGKGLVQRWLASEGPISSQTPVYSVGTYDQTVPFYLRRTITLVEYRDEMDMGLTAEPHLNGPTEAALLESWPGLARAYAIIDLGKEQHWRARGVPMRVVSRNGRRVVVANR